MSTLGIEAVVSADQCVDERQCHIHFRDALNSLGTVLKPNQEKRDGVHLPVLRVTAAHKLSPNQDVGLLPDGQASAFSEKKFGKVDPFLKNIVQRGEAFWLVLYPGQITSLRHVWFHPSIPGAQKKTYVSSTATSSTLAGDKRSVETSAQLGKLVHVSGVPRDAVHWAVMPVVAAERLSPNEDVGFLPDGRVASTLGDITPFFGKIDPFLSRMIEPGEECWFVMYPSQVHSLFHMWDHPLIAFEDKEVNEKKVEKPTDDSLTPPKEQQALVNNPPTSMASAETTTATVETASPREQKLQEEAIVDEAEEEEEEEVEEEEVASKVDDDDEDDECAWMRAQEDGDC